MKFASPAVGFLTIVLLIALPVGGNPALSVGSKASYNVKATISFPPFLPCSGSSYPLGSTPGTCVGVAFLPPPINVTGTLGWSVSDLTSTTAVLNITRDLTVSHDGIMAPSTRDMGSFNESINLATRTISIMPFLRMELDAALQSAESSMSASLPTGIDPNLMMSTFPSSIVPRPVYTMWWMNETLHQGQIVPVLIFPTNVTRSTTIDLGQLGTRDAWTLVFNLTKIFPQPDVGTVATTYPTWVDHDFGVVLTFNYDQKSGLLLSASADIHTGFELIEPQQCGISTSPKTPGSPCTTPNIVTSPVESCGFDIKASLILASTSLNLDQSMTSANPSSGGENSGGNSGPSSGSMNNGGTSPGSSGAGSGSGSPSGSQSSTQPAPRPSSTGSLLYLILGAIAVAIVVASLLFVRRRPRRNGPQTSPQP